MYGATPSITLAATDSTRRLTDADVAVMLRWYSKVTSNIEFATDPRFKIPLFVSAAAVAAYDTMFLLSTYRLTESPEAEPTWNM